MTGIHFTRVDYSSYCTPANVGGLPGTAWLGPGTSQRCMLHEVYSSLVLYTIGLLITASADAVVSLLVDAKQCLFCCPPPVNQNRLAVHSTMLPVERPLAFTSRRPNVVRSPGYYISSSPACGVLAVPFISPCSQVARWWPQGRIAVIHWIVPVHSESWVNCEESIYSRPIACRLARFLALYPPRTSRLAPRILP